MRCKILLQNMQECRKKEMTGLILKRSINVLKKALLISNFQLIVEDILDKGKFVFKHLLRVKHFLIFPL